MSLLTSAPVFVPLLHTSSLTWVSPWKEKKEEKEQEEEEEEKWALVWSSSFRQDTLSPWKVNLPVKSEQQPHDITSSFLKISPKNSSFHHLYSFWHFWWSKSNRKLSTEYCYCSLQVHYNMQVRKGGFPSLAIVRLNYWVQSCITVILQILSEHIPEEPNPTKPSYIMGF